MHLGVGGHFNSGFNVCYMELQSVNLKQVSGFEGRKGGISAMHYRLDITPNHLKLPLHPLY